AAERGPDRRNEGAVPDEEQGLEGPPRSGGEGERRPARLPREGAACVHQGRRRVGDGAERSGLCPAELPDVPYQGAPQPGGRGLAARGGEIPEEVPARAPDRPRAGGTGPARARGLRGRAR